MKVRFTNESNITVDEGVGMFEVCVEKNLQTIKDLTIDVVSRDQTAYGNGTLYAIKCTHNY